MSLLEIGKEVAYPRRQVFLKRSAICPGWGAEISARQPRHDFAQRGGMIFRFSFAVDALDAEPCEVVAQARQRALIQEAGKIIRTIGHQFAAPNADEQIEELTLDPLDICRLRRLGERRVGETER